MSVPVLFSVLRPCPSPPSLPSGRPPALAWSCSSFSAAKVDFFFATARLNRCDTNKAQVEVHLIKKKVEADAVGEEDYSSNRRLKLYLSANSANLELLRTPV